MRARRISLGLGWAGVVGVVGMLAVVTSVAGCAAMRRQQGLQMDRMLAAAGFHVRPANTPAKMAQLKTLTPLTIMPRQKDGKTYYVVADPDTCQCLYVGNEAAYDTYQRLALRQEYVQDRLATAEMNEAASMDWGMWGGPWGPW